MDPLPPDPYRALGISRDADTATIKSTYRKLALKCHPDKVTDESLKQQKQEEFHKIQQAYELVGDEDKRARYDAEVKLDQLRREKFARTSSAATPDVKNARYDVRTAAPKGAAFSANVPHHRYEDRKTSAHAHDDDRYYDERTRKYDTYEAYPKHNSTSRSARAEKEPIRITRYTTDRTRSEQKKSRDKEERRDRSGKFVVVEDDYSSNDDKARYEAAYKRRSEEDAIKKAAHEARLKADERRSAEYDRIRKLNDMENDALRYINRSKADAESRPSPSRTTSSRDVRPEYYERTSSRRDRPEAVRRSSARPKDRERERDRKGIPEIVDWENDRKPPSFKHSSSSPADLHVPRTTPQRSYTESSRDHRRTETSPTPLRRSETMPTSVPLSSSSRRKEPTSTRSSNLRNSESVTPRESSIPEKTYAPVPSPQASTTKKYYYTPGGGVNLRPEDVGVGVANGHRTVLREPERRRSPSPLTRPPMGANRPSDTSSSKYTTATAAPKDTMPPPLGRSATMNVSPSRDERGRSRLYGEIPSDHTRRENARRQTSFSPDKVSYARRDFRPEDISYSTSRGRDRLNSKDREYAPRPPLGRTTTSVY